MYSLATNCQRNPNYCVRGNKKIQTLMPVKNFRKSDKPSDFKSIIQWSLKTFQIVHWVWGASNFLILYYYSQ